MAYALVQPEAFVAPRFQPPAYKISGDIPMEPECIRGRVDDPERRGANWRWWMAQQVANHDLKTYPRDRKDDALVMQSVAPYFQGTDTKDLAGYRSTAKQFPNLHWARKVYEEKQVDKYIIEAYLTAGTTPEVIAHAFDVEPASVWWYANTFFDIQAQIDNRTWMAAYVFHPALEGIDPLRGAVWKLLGWKNSLGVDAVDLLTVPGSKLSEAVVKAINDLIDQKNIQDVLTVVLSSSYTKYDRMEALGAYTSMRSANAAIEAHATKTPAEQHFSEIYDAVGEVITKRKRSEVTQVELSSDDFVTLFADRTAQKQQEDSRALTIS